MYTSGCPKNQNKCWYNTGSPPPEGSKNAVLKLRSVKSIVIAPANTGNDRSNKNAVIKTDHTNKGVLWKYIPKDLMFIIVVIKLMAPAIEEAPAICKLNIARSTDAPGWYSTLDKGG